MTQHPSIDHGLLSPNGRMSARARQAAMAREGQRLFAGIDLRGIAPIVPAWVTLRRQAALLRDLAGRGMQPRKYLKEAIKLEAAAAELDQTP